MGKIWEGGCNFLMLGWGGGGGGVIIGKTRKTSLFQRNYLKMAHTN